MSDLVDVVPEQRHTVVDGLRLHWLDWGRRGLTPIVFLHGGGLSAHTWDSVCPELRESYHCIALDQRGHGDSEWSPGSDYTLDAHLRDLEGYLDSLGPLAPVLVGQSLGAMNAMRYAARHPDTPGLVLIDIGRGAGRSQGLDRIVDFSLGASTFDSIDEIVERAVRFNPRRDPDVLRQSIPHRVRRLPDGRWTWKRDDRHLSRGWLAGLAAQVEIEMEHEPPKVHCPVLIVRGGDSDVLSEDGAAAFAARFTQARHVTVPDAGHNVQGDNPAGLLDVLRPFFAELSWA